MGVRKSVFSTLGLPLHVIEGRIEAVVHRVLDARGDADALALAREAVTLAQRALQRATSANNTAESAAEGATGCEDMVADLDLRVAALEKAAAVAKPAPKKRASTKKASPRKRTPAKTKTPPPTA